MIYRDIDLRKGMGYEPVASPYQFQRPDRAFQHPAVQDGTAAVFQIGVDIWGVYLKPVAA